ncbi:MAG: ABC transporter substrate-binding protein [Muribaculaceae bacterium]|nr:ABC transporter substrate-binding protein [Muribaculaceae bacterium]
MILNKSTNHRLVATLLRVAMLMLIVTPLLSCGGAHSRSMSDGDGRDIEMHYADYLSITEQPGYTDVTIRNPWDTTATLQHLYLVPKDSILPAGLPTANVIRTPVSNALIYSGVHTGLISELGASQAIGGICDANYVTDSIMQVRLKAGTLTDCGLSQNPDIERIISLSPDLIMLSPYENDSHLSRIQTLGIPILQCADYMETSPLGRAEWMRLYGLIFGVRDKSERLFSDIESEYLHLKEIASTADYKPAVLIDQRYGQVWNVPAGHSTMGRLIEDAGGRNPFSDYKQSGSVALSPEQVLARAHDADIWFVRYNQKSEKTLTELANDAPVNSRFRAFRQGNVFGCNTQYTNYFDETPFHPERVLRDMVIYIHPDLLPDATPSYYHKMK